jgi:hypothetical protein
MSKKFTGWAYLEVDDNGNLSTLIRTPDGSAVGPANPLPVDLVNVETVTIQGAAAIVPYSTFTKFTKTMTGSAVQLSATSIPCRGVKVRPQNQTMDAAVNAGDVGIGLDADCLNEFLSKANWEGIVLAVDDASKVWFKGTNGDKVIVTILN